MLTFHDQFGNIATGSTTPYGVGWLTNNNTFGDQYGNIATGYTGTVQFSSSDVQAGLPQNYTFTPADAGVFSFTASLLTAGTQSLTATDTSNSSLTATLSGITVKPGAASIFVVTGFPTPIMAGQAGNFTVTAKDAYNNTVSGYTGTVQFSSSDVQAGLPQNYTFTTADAGVHSFTATLLTAGTQSLTATDTANSSLTATLSGITVNPAAASIFVVTGFPIPIVAGLSGDFTVTAKDAYNNTASGYTGTVTFSSTDPLATLPGHSMLTNGSGTFSAAFHTGGTQSLTATDSSNSSLDRHPVRHHGQRFDRHDQRHRLSRLQHQRRARSGRARHRRADALPRP